MVPTKFSVALVLTFVGINVWDTTPFHRPLNSPLIQAFICDIASWFRLPIIHSIRSIFFFSYSRVVVCSPSPLLLAIAVIFSIFFVQLDFSIVLFFLYSILLIDKKAATEIKHNLYFVTFVIQRKDFLIFLCGSPFSFCSIVLSTAAGLACLIFQCCYLLFMSCLFSLFFVLRRFVWRLLFIGYSGNW